MWTVECADCGEFDIKRFATAYEAALGVKKHASETRGEHKATISLERMPQGVEVAWREGHA